MLFQTLGATADGGARGCPVLVCLPAQLHARDVAAVVRRIDDGMAECRSLRNVGNAGRRHPSVRRTRVHLPRRGQEARANQLADGLHGLYMLNSWEHVCRI